MSLGELNSTGLWIWVFLVGVAVWLVRGARRQALEAFGDRALKERRASLLALLLPVASILLSILFVGIAEGAMAGETEAVPETGNAEVWRKVSLFLMMGNAVSSMVACALIVLGMLRSTTTWFILMADVATAVAALVSLWAVITNYPPPV